MPDSKIKTPNWADLPPLRDVINRYELRAEKKLGQNFLLDSNITDKIVKYAGDLSNMTVFEIGPGPGGLTRSLLKAGVGKLVAIEFDLRAVEALKELEEFSGGRLHVIHADALEIDLLSFKKNESCAIMANLPYNIATPLLMKWLKQIRDNDDAYKQMILMFQKEVAERIVSKHGSKSYGRLSVISQWLCETESLFTLSPQAFTPPPKVKSSIVKFLPKTLSPNAPDFSQVEKITACAFGQRRKMIRSSLKDYADAFEACGLDSSMRAENVSVESYISMANL